MDYLNGLSNREREVTELLLEGKSNKQIASSLHITDHTVEFHLKNIYSKCQVSSRTELIIKLRDSVVADNRGNDENKDWRTSSKHVFTSLKEAASRICEELKMEKVLNLSTPHGENPLTFKESILICLKKYAEFTGRASRSEFWWFTLFILLVASALTYLSQTLGNIFLIAVLLPQLAAGARRLHDIGKSAWWQLFLLVPVGGLVLVGILWALPTTKPQTDDTLPA